MARIHVCLALLFGLLVWIGCGSEQAPTPKPSADLPQGILVSLARFVEQEGPDGKTRFLPGPARVEFLFRKNGSWQVVPLDDPDSNVFHKAMVYPARGGPVLLTLGGTRAIVKTWEPGASGLRGTVRWEKDFGGKFSRMRDAEVGDLYGDGSAVIAVATHDQGVVALMRPQADGSFEVMEIDHEENTVVHEIEIGDLDQDGVLEVYATPSEPNRLDGTPQHGVVVRYVPAAGEGRVVVADLGDRHAKEILVADVDGDGRDELYVSVEGQVSGNGANQKLEHPVEIRRYDADTPATGGHVVGSLDDQLTRFMTVGDADGDGVSEMAVASFKKGLWLFRPGSDPRSTWTKLLIDADSGGFEHASIFADLDGDGRDELYVASDDHKQIRRYVWDGNRFAREVIYTRPDSNPIFTWNLMPVPVELIPAH